MTTGQHSQSLKWLILAGTFCSLTMSGCLSPITLNRAVTIYDEAAPEAISKQLLINIARKQPSPDHGAHPLNPHLELIHLDESEG